MSARSRYADGPTKSKFSEDYMTPVEIEKLIERLHQASANHVMFFGASPVSSVMNEAAAALSACREENAKLKAAVDQFANSAEAHAGGTDYNPPCGGCRTLLKKHAAAIALAQGLQKLGGWADIRMVLRYAHLDPGYLAQYADNAKPRNVTRRVTGTG